MSALIVSNIDLSFRRRLSSSIQSKWNRVFILTDYLCVRLFNIAENVDLKSHGVQLGSGAVKRPSQVRLSENKQIVLKLRSENDGLVDGGFEHFELIKDTRSIKCEIAGWRILSVLHYHTFDRASNKPKSLVFMTCQEEVPENLTRVPLNILTVFQVTQHENGVLTMDDLAKVPLENGNIKTHLISVDSDTLFVKID